VTDRGPGWPTVLALVLVVITFSVVQPLQLIAIPLVLLLVALPPRRPGSLVVAAALAALSFTGPRGELWYVERGWALVLGGWFLVAVLVAPRGSFIARALAATGAAAATAAGLVLVRGGWAALDWAIATRYREVADSVGRSWPGVGVDAAVVAELAAELPARLFPGLTALGSVAALAVAWWAYRRLSGLDRPLGRFTRFRFPDGMVWVLIAGLVLIIAPLAAWAPRLGSNLVVFMGALYALRGLAVMIAVVLGLAGTQPGVLLALGVVAVLLYPIVVAGTLLLGVTDTWLDLRSGRRRENEEG
jgi:hypothetical protein